MTFRCKNCGIYIPKVEQTQDDPIEHWVCPFCGETYLRYELERNETVNRITRGLVEEFGAKELCNFSESIQRITKEYGQRFNEEAPK